VISDFIGFYINLIDVSAARLVWMSDGLYLENLVDAVGINPTLRPSPCKGNGLIPHST